MTSAILAACLMAAAPAARPYGMAVSEGLGRDLGRARTVAGGAPRRLVLRVHRRAPLDDRLLDAAMRQVERIWEPYGFSVLWSVATADAPETPEQASDVPLTVVIHGGGPDGESGAEARSAIGWVEFLAPDRPRNVVNVSTAAALRLMAGARLGGRRLDGLPGALQARFMAQAIGRSLAHEVGHYVLRSTEHAERGLMRALFSPDELFDTRMNRYDLDDREQARLGIGACPPGGSPEAQSRRVDG